MFNDNLARNLGEYGSERQRDFKTFQNSFVMPFYKEIGKQGVFAGVDNKKIIYNVFENPQAHSALIFITGYNESFYKYDELIYDLWHEGFSIFTYDHRGQGFSERLSQKNDGGYVDDFQYFIEDLSVFYNAVVLPKIKNNIPLYCLGHSMGGMILLSAALQNKISPKGVVLSSPMLQVNLPMPPLVALFIARMMRFLGQKKSYVFTQGTCVPLLPFATNDVTNCFERFDHWRHKIDKNIEMRLGGPTFQWVEESVKACLSLERIRTPVKVPTLILQAGDDTVVQNKAQDSFLAAQHKLFAPVQIIKYPNAKHEIFMERDDIRFVALNDFLAFAKNC